MTDKRGIMRGFCKTCGEHECNQYEPKEDGSCSYCFCAPTVHIRITESEKTAEKVSLISANAHENPDESVISDLSTATCASTTKLNRWAKKGQKIKTKLKTGSQSSTNKSRFSLPTFSPGLQDGLKNEKHAEKCWPALIEECASHFIGFNPVNSGDYRQIGLLIMQNYPQIILDGRTPWQRFTKCLSRKIREKRIAARICEFREVEEITESNSNIGQPSELCQIFRDTLIRNKEIEHNANISEPWKQLATEFLKKTPCSETIKVLLKASFSNRTELYKSDMASIFELYPCLINSEWIHYELEIIAGYEVFEKICNNIKLFCAKINHVEKSGNAIVGLELLDNKIRTMLGMKTQPIIKIATDELDYMEIIRSNRNCSPYIAARKVDGELITDACICAYERVIVSKGPVEDIITTYVCLILAFDVDFPKRNHLISIIKSFAFGECFLPSLPKKITSYSGKYF